MLYEVINHIDINLLLDRQTERKMHSCCESPSCIDIWKLYK